MCSNCTYTSVQDAINSANASDTVFIHNGTYVTSLDIIVPISVVGEDSVGVIIDASSFDDYGIFIGSSHVVLANLSLVGPAFPTRYGIHASGSNTLLIDNVRVTGSGRTGIDLNGVNDSILRSAISSSNGGAGIAVTDSRDISIILPTTNGNTWGGIALYAAGFYYPVGTDHITISNASLAETLPIFTYAVGNATITNITIPFAGFRYLLGNSSAPYSSIYLSNLSTALGFAALDAGAQAFVLDRITGEYLVGPGMSIQAAINAAPAAKNVLVWPGTFNGNIIINTSTALIGNQTTLDCLGTGTGISLIAPSSSVEGFTISSCDTGIDTSVPSSISNNSFVGNDVGVFTNTTTSVTLLYNRFSGNVVGLNSTASGLLAAEFNDWDDCTGPNLNATGVPGSGELIFGVIDYTPWVGVCFGNLTADSCAFENQALTLRANVSSSISLSDVTFSTTINGTTTNHTGNQQGAIYIYTVPASSLAGGQTLDWTVFARDTLGNTFGNGNDLVYIHQSTSMDPIPSLPDGAQGWYLNEPIFTLSGDPTATRFYYRWDSDSPITYIGPFNLDSIPNAPPKASAGTLELNWWGQFTCGNESAHSAVFRVDLTDPVISAVSPSNGSIVRMTKPNITAYIDEVYQSNSGIVFSSVSMTVDGIAVNASVVKVDGLDARTTYIPSTPLSAGVHTITVNASDNASRSSSGTWSFTVDTTPAFNWSVHAPLSGIYATRQLSFNISMTDPVTLKYIVVADSTLRANSTLPRPSLLCKNCVSYGLEKKATKSVREGNNTIIFFAEDSSGNIQETRIPLFVDSRAPRILSLLPKRDQYTNGSGFSVKFSEDNPVDVIALINGTSYPFTECSLDRNNWQCNASFSLSALDGDTVPFTVVVSDPLRNTTWREQDITIDTSAPVILNNKTAYASGRLIQFNISIEEAAFAKVSYMDFSDASPRSKTLCTKLSGNYCTKSVPARPGDHPLTIIVSDKAGNAVQMESYVTI